MNILEVKDLTKHFGGLTAIHELDLHIAKGEILGLIGPNGAGKSTLFNCVAGVFPPSAGDIRFKGEPTAGKKPWDLCRLGLARTFQIVKPFGPKTVSVQRDGRRLSAHRLNRQGPRQGHGGAYNPSARPPGPNSWPET